MLLFGVEYILALVIAFLDNKKNKKIIFGLLIIFAFLFSFRNITMNKPGDIEVYRYYYENIHDAAVVNRNNFELGYYFLNIVFSFFGLPFGALQVAIGILFTVMMWKCSDYYTKYPGVCLLASLFFLFYYATGALRQSITIPIAFYAFRYLTEENIEHGKRLLNIVDVKRRNLIKYFITCSILFLFHGAAIFLFLLPMIKSRKGKILILATGIGFAFLFPYLETLISYIPYINTRYSYYKLATLESGAEGWFSFRLLEYIIIFVILLLKKEKDSVEKFSVDLLFLGIFTQIVLSSYLVTAYRLLQYTDLGIVLFSGKFYGALNSFSKKIIFIGIVALLVLFRFISLVSSNSGLGLHYSIMGL